MSRSLLLNNILHVKFSLMCDFPTFCHNYTHGIVLISLHGKINLAKLFAEWSHFKELKKPCKGNVKEHNIATCLTPHTTHIKMGKIRGFLYN